jgi:nitrous oxidase accessory protein NosD
LTGICVHGRLDFSNPAGPTLAHFVPNVSIRGFRIRGFSGDGIFGFGTRDMQVRNNRLIGNRGYGLFSVLGKRPRIRHNVATRNREAGIYVGDSPAAHAVVRNNRASRNGTGILLRHASIGRVTHNVVVGNCVGIEVLADAPGPAKKWLIAGNRAIGNNRACPGDPDEGPALSGIGIALFGARDTVVRNNVVRHHRREHPSLISAGIVVARGAQGSPPRRDRVVGNLALGNRPNDIAWDGSGGVNFVANACRRAKPGKICR